MPSDPLLPSVDRIAGAATSDGQGVAPLAASPLFIVGSPRSGTSILVDAAFAAGFNGFREGNLLGLLWPLYERIDDYFRRFDHGNDKTLISHARRDIIRMAVREIFRKELDELNVKKPWLDKTGNAETILIIPDLIEMWPNCRVIFAHRRAIENMLSRLRKFPGLTFDDHCRAWTRSMCAWRKARDRLPSWRFREVDQRDLVVRPEIVSQAMVTLLGLGETASNRIVHTFRRLRPQETEPGTAERVTPLADTRWTQAQIDTFMTICGPEMEAFGYSLDGTYWQDVEATRRP